MIRVRWLNRAASAPDAAAAAAAAGSPTLGNRFDAQLDDF